MDDPKMKDMVSELDHQSGVSLILCLVVLLFCIVTAMFGLTALFTGHFMTTIFALIFLVPQVSALQYFEGIHDTTNNQLRQTREIYQRHVDTLELFEEEMK